MQSSLKKKVAEKKKLIYSLRQLLDKVLRTTISKYYLTCGKKGCRCKGGKKHGPYFYLSVTRDGKTKMDKIPKGLEGKVLKGVRAYNEIWRKLSKLCDLNREILWLKKERRQDEC